MRGFFERGKHGQDLMRLARSDLEAFERGGVDNDVGPGLLMALMTELAERLGVNDDPRRLMLEALMRVDEVVRGKQLERPVMFSFGNAPYS